MPGERQRDDDHSDDDSVNNEHAKTIGLQIPNQPGDRGIANQSRNDDANDEWRMHSRRQSFFMKFVGLEEHGASDNGRREQKTEAHGRFPRHVAEQAGGNGRSGT